MKKRIAFLLSVVLSLLLAASALADRDLLLFYDAAMELLFETDNVTLSGEAEFALDGERFKTANLTHIQDYKNSHLRLDLKTPRRDGSGRPDRESGYTVIANAENIYVMDVIDPGVYRTGSAFPQTSVLRRSVQTGLMADLLRLLADQAGVLLGEDAFTVQSGDAGGRVLRITLDKEVPELVNTALNLFWEFIAKRYFDTDYDRVSERFMATLDGYMTVAEGILNTTERVSLKNADVTAVRDTAGRLEQIRGKMSLFLDTARDGKRQLDVSFRLDVSDRDGSHVETFDPKKYGVTKKEAEPPEEAASD